MFEKWSETVVVDLEMAGGDCAECLVLMWLIVIRGRSLSETLTDRVLNYGFILIKGWNQTWHILTSLIIDNNLEPVYPATPNTLEIKLKTFNDPACLTGPY